MGCDIHSYRERLERGQWVSADEWEPCEFEPTRLRVPYDKQIYSDRHYNLFGLLAKGVRTEHELSIEPKGLPNDVSEPVLSERYYWGVDGHSHSYLTLAELKELRTKLDTNVVTLTGMMDIDQLEKLKASLASDKPDYALVYPYCKWTSDIKSVPFSVDVPASWELGDDLDKIIERLEAVGGEDQRMVFWFDN